ncbi:DUF2865 domain-containing protein [Labrenzia aggregata]|uniref:DUF2865 domain-containing protein n=1 Tax=Roseibium aggregatum TaxID=187304 RepID=A0A939EAR8_9HYPH|nr:DUF2865 domain-containing protein [Roseibium aggregatum]
MRPWKSARSVGSLVLLCLLAATASPWNAAQAASCSSLNAELRRLESASASPSKASNKWSTARRQQQKAIAAAERDANYFGCPASGAPKCKVLSGKIKRMKANLRAIDRQLRKTGGGGGSRDTRRIRQIRTSLERQNCNGPAKVREARTENRPAGEKPRNLFQRLFNPGAMLEAEAPDRREREIVRVRSHQKSETPRRLRLPSGGLFRTLCVRTCDGYFFPVSYSTDKGQFINDAARCSEICPASETELYVYRNPGGDQSEMMSLAGTLYSDQPFAYRYRDKLVKNCSCRAAGQSKTRSAWRELNVSPSKRVYFSDISAGVPGSSRPSGRNGAFAGTGAASSPLSRTPLQKARLPLFQDPDTLFNLEKGFDVSADLDRADTLRRDENTLAVSGGKPGSALPLLSIRARTDTEGDDIATVSPVFRNDDDGFRAAPEEKRSVRVVGPEYFVAQ